MKRVKKSKPPLRSIPPADEWENFLQLWWVIGFDTLDKFPIVKAEYYEQLRKDLLEYMTRDDFKQ